MANLPYQSSGETATGATYHVVPDPIKGGWNVYNTMEPQEPQQYFNSKEEAIRYAEETSLAKGVGYIVEENEAPRAGRR